MLYFELAHMNEMTAAQFKKKLGNRILVLRTKIGLTQEQVAHRMNKDKQFINRYEVTGANPTAHILKKLAKALEVSVDELLEV